MPFAADLRPVRLLHDVLAIPTYLRGSTRSAHGRDGIPCRGTRPRPARTEVLDFHPNMVYLNAADDDHYQATRPSYHDPQALLAARNPGRGVRTLLIELLEEIAAGRFQTVTAGEIIGSGEHFPAYWVDAGSEVAAPLTVHVLEPGEEAAGRTSSSDRPTPRYFMSWGSSPITLLAVSVFTISLSGTAARLFQSSPGGVIENAEGATWRSPIGASIGGPALPPHQRLPEVLAIVEAVQQHARHEQWKAIEITLPPAVYHPSVGDVTGFALFRQGFRETRCWLCPMIDSAAAPADVPAVETVFERRQLQALRAAVRRGSMALETGIEGLEDFRPVFDETYARHGTRPTHTIEEYRHAAHSLSGPGPSDAHA